jgi:hypothetical protein
MLDSFNAAADAARLTPHGVSDRVLREGTREPAVGIRSTAVCPSRDRQCAIAGSETDSVCVITIRSCGAPFGSRA